MSLFRLAAGGNAFVLNAAAGNALQPTDPRQGNRCGFAGGFVFEIGRNGDGDHRTGGAAGDHESEQDEFHDVILSEVVVPKAIYRRRSPLSATADNAQAAGA